MKNIHLLPTDKPSRLFKDNFNTLFFSINIDQEQNHFKPQNLFITSNEEIEDGDWVLIIDDFETYIHEHKGDNLPTTYCKKIILTTDQDLIKDGVQAIDDEFLEWFVENPGCEFVHAYNDRVVGYEYDNYTIIIPTEETKWDKLNKELDDALELEFSLDKSIFDKMASLSESKEPKQESVFETAKLTLRKHLLENKEKVAADLEEMRERSNTNKQETLEEAAERISKTNSVYETAQDDFYHGFIDGAKWQQERSYSEEEVVSFIHKFLKEHQPQLPYLIGGINMWFGQYKKK